MNDLPIPEEWRSRAIVVDDTDLPRSWFSEEELGESQSFRLAKRRDEFLLSRAAAKSLALRLGLTGDPSTCRIENRRIGTRHLSLSHSAPYAGAAIDREPVGIDVQVIRPIRESAGHLFLTDGETALMQSLSLDDRLIHFWCAKEALWKRHGGAVETLRRVPLLLREARASGLQFADVETTRIGDVVVALTLPTS